MKGDHIMIAFLFWDGVNQFTFLSSSAGEAQDSVKVNVTRSSNVKIKISNEIQMIQCPNCSAWNFGYWIQSTLTLPWGGHKILDKRGTGVLMKGLPF
ncbi:MAG: hypothetical protein AB1487_07390 [Thermodesulfobacteriota bacterium]